MSWVMTHERQDGEYLFRIGAVLIVKIRFQKIGQKWVCFADYHNETRSYDSMSAALQEMHQLLKSPPSNNVETAQE